MNPKEKAKELLDKSFVELLKVLENKGYNLNLNDVNEAAKQCALIAVEEILKEVPTEILDTYGGETNFIINERFEYWQQVKTEIENL